MKSIPRLALVGPAPERHGAPRALLARLRPRAEKVGGATLAKGDAANRGVVESAPVVDVGNDFVITCITAESALPHWRGAWRRLLAESLSPEKIYQTPEFFRFLVDTRTAGADQFELFLITHRVHDKVVGIVPVRISSIALDIGPATWQPRVVRILGSVPLMPADAALMQHLCTYLLRAFPDCAAVSMQAFPIEMQAQVQGGRRHRTLVLHGWRDCHTIPLPDAWPAYTARLSAKKRYNLTRQYRLLEQATGPLQLERIDRACAVKLLSEGVGALAPQGDPARKAARDYRVLAANRLLLSYVLRSADDIVAVIVGSRYGDTWHVYQILYAPAYHHLSAGTVALHTALQDVVTHFAFTSADLGFGSPRERFASTHALKTRAHVLIARRGSWRAHLLGAFIRFDHARTVCASRIKPLLRRISRP
jgi:CelD/BcsL family acetyltransferase involved in cellulose biosynthesis